MGGYFFRQFAQKKDKHDKTQPPAGAPQSPWGLVDPPSPPWGPNLKRILGLSLGLLRQLRGRVISDPMNSRPPSHRVQSVSSTTGGGGKRAPRWAAAVPIVGPPSAGDTRRWRPEPDGPERWGAVLREGRACGKCGATEVPSKVQPADKRFAEKCRGAMRGPAPQRRRCVSYRS